MATGDHDWTANEVVTAANMDDFVQLQVVAQYASAAARDTALSARKREGMVAYLLDVNTLTVYSGAAWSTVGPIHGGLTSWSPTINQSGAVTVTVVTGTYSRIGRLVFFQGVFSVTGTGSAGVAVVIALPVTANSSSIHSIVGLGHITDTSATLRYTAELVIATTTTFKFGVQGNGVAEPTYQGVGGFTAALASTDVIAVYGWYEAAGDA